MSPLRRPFVGSTSATKRIYKQEPDLGSRSTVRTTLLAILAMAMLVASATSVIAQPGSNPTAEDASQRGQDRRDSDDDSGDDGDVDEAGDDRGRSGENQGRGRDNQPPTPISIGHFTVDSASNVADGEFVTFTYDAGGLQGFTAGGVTLFDLNLTGRSLGEVEELEVEGSKLKFKADGLKVVVHDNPAAVSRIESDEPITLSFANGSTITPNAGGRHYTFTVGNVSGKIKGDNVALNGTQLVLQGDVLVMLDSLRAVVDKNRPEILDAIGKGHVGAEASFNALDENEVEQEVVSYGNVTMTTVKAERGNLTVLIDGHGFDGRVLVLNVDGRIVGASEAEHLDIQFDNESMQRADSLADVLDPDNDGLVAEYYVVFDPETQAFQLLVSVPHYSVHTLSVGLVEILPPPSVIVGILGGVALLVPSGYALFARRKR